MSGFVISFALLFSFTIGQDIKYADIKYAAIIYRHGDRTPVDPYPTDPYRNESLWPVKFGELTNTGKRQHFALGQWFRRRYSHLISDEFDPTEIYVKSTDVDRTLMSAQANLAGMYPPKGKTIWDSHLMWQPIPVHTMPQKDDPVLSMKKPCPAYEVEKERLLHSKDYKERLKKYQSLMDYLTAHTGLVVKDYLEIEYIYNTLNIEALYNFTLPSWTKAVYPDQMREPSCYSFRVPTLTPLMANIKVGPLLKEISINMLISSLDENNDSKLGLSEKNKRKLSVYSGHDDTIGAILNALNMFDGNCPVYTATILFELLEKDGETYVRISYRNSTEIVEPHVLSIPYCGELCPLLRFTKLYEHMLLFDWAKECGAAPYQTSFYDMFFFVAICFITFKFVGCIVNTLENRISERFAARSKATMNPMCTKNMKIEGSNVLLLEIKA